MPALVGASHTVLPSDDRGAPPWPLCACSPRGENAWVHDRTSWDSIAAIGDGRTVAAQGGPRPLADDIEQVWDQWISAGRPSPYEYGMTVKPDRQYVRAHVAHTGTRWPTGQRAPWAPVRRSLRSPGQGSSYPEEAAADRELFDTHQGASLSGGQSQSVAQDDRIRLVHGQRPVDIGAPAVRTWTGPFQRCRDRATQPHPLAPAQAFTLQAAGHQRTLPDGRIRATMPIPNS